ncbi:hypothetical protein CFOL_v3_23054, partial [Cephalotus follicularis]
KTLLAVRFFCGCVRRSFNDLQFYVILSLVAGVFVGNSFDDDDGEYSHALFPDHRLQLAIINDGKDEVINMTEGFVQSGQLMLFTDLFTARVLAHLMGFVTEYLATNCATAFVRGEASLRVDLNVPLPHGSYPLHHAASVFSLHLIDLYLQHGANIGVVYNGLLPLNVALEKLCYHNYLVDWTPKDSIFKLITILCLPQMVRLHFFYRFFNLYVKMSFKIDC